MPITIRQPDNDDATRFRAAVSAGMPQLITPASGAVLAAGQRFTWTAVAGTTSYMLELLDANGRSVTQASTKDTSTVLSSSVTAADRALFQTGNQPGLVAKGAPTLPEPHASWVDPLEKEWARRYGV